MRIRAFAACAIALAAMACGGAGLFRQYEYEEDMYLSLDGSATMYVNASVAALNALRGTSFDANPAHRFNPDEFRAYFSSGVTRVTRVNVSRHNGRRFVHLRLDVDDVRKLSQAAPFAWSTYRLERRGSQFVYSQTVGRAAGGPGNDVNDVRQAGWNGREIVAFRMHLPSKIEEHNTPTHEVGRGNILAWDQPLTDRLRGVPLSIEAKMQTQSILYRTLWLFGLTFAAVAIAFAATIFWVLRKGATAPRALESHAK
jgi:hypothetical protein